PALIVLYVCVPPEVPQGLPSAAWLEILPVVVTVPVKLPSVAWLRIRLRSPRSSAPFPSSERIRRLLELGSVRLRIPLSSTTSPRLCKTATLVVRTPSRTPRRAPELATFQLLTSLSRVKLPEPTL